MHIIRLHGPWEYQPFVRFVMRAGSVEESDDLPPSGRVEIPGDWRETLGDDFYGRVRFMRHFHRPTGLETGQRVFLAVERVCLHGRVWLNEQLLGNVAYTGGPFRFEVSKNLDVRNLLAIEVELPPPENPGSARPDCELQPGGLVGWVRLEIEEPD